MNKNYTEKELYEFCKEEKFNQESIINFCRINGIDLGKLIKKVSNYSRYTIHNNKLTQIEDEELFFIEGKEIALLIKKYKKFIDDRAIEIREISFKGMKKRIKEALLQYFIEVNFNKKEIEKKFLNWNLDFNENVEMIARYTINEKDNEIWNKEKITQCFSSLTNKKIETIDELLQNVLKTENENDYISIIENSIQIISIKRIYAFLNKYLPEDREKIEINLKEKLKVYDNRKSKQPINKNEKQKMYLEIARKAIRNYIEQDILPKQNELNSYLNIIKEYDKDLFKRYIEKIEIAKQRNYYILYSVSIKIIDGIKNGITENDYTRPFDLLDYYSITNLDKRIILRFLKDKFPNDVSYFLNFIRKYPNTSILDEKKIQYICDNDEYIRNQFDENGKRIVNPRTNITRDEKILILNYLKENNIPLYDTLYFIALKRYLNGNLILEENTKNI